MVVKRQTVWSDGVSEMIGRVTVTQQVNELSVVCGGEDDVEIAAVNNQLSEHRFACGDPLDRVCAPKQFIQQKQMRCAVRTRPHQPKQCLDLDEVVALARQQVVRSSDAT